MRYGIISLVFVAHCLLISSTASAQTSNCNGVTVTVGASAKQAKQCVKPGGGAAKDQSFRDCPDCPEMVVVPSGSFLMGSPNHEVGKESGTDIDHYVVHCDPEKPARIECHNEHEGPLHKVSMPRPFAIGKFAVTFAEWDACIAEDGCDARKPRDEGWGRGQRPVIFISWTAARNFVKWLSKKTGHTYRLPSEAEWEYAARAGTSTPYWWGKTITTDRGNFDKDNSRTDVPPYNGEPGGVFRDQTLPVDAFQPNPWGLYQVHGNVWEWAEDCFHYNYEKKPADLKKTGGAWTVGRCISRVLRGGAFNADRYASRSASRHREYYKRTGRAYGFRVVRDLP